MPVAFTRIVAGLDTSSPFVGGKVLERRRGRPYRARLGANESLFGVPPAALRVLASLGPELCFYCDPTHMELRGAIAKIWRLSCEHLVVGEGIDGLLGLFARAFIEPGDVAVTSRGAYPTLDYHVPGYGGRLVYSRYQPFGNDLDALVAAARRHRAKMLYLANPDNPTGAMIASSDLTRLLDCLPDDCLLLLDEAYVEFSPAADVLPCEETRPNLVRLRTFSKVYGLAGARIGYAIADPAIIATLDRIRLHFAVSKLSQEIALAALGDTAFVARILAQTEEGRQHYAVIASQIGVDILPSATNFVSFDFGDPTRSQAMADWLEDHDIFVRRPKHAPLDRLIRVTVGPPASRDYLAEVLAAGMANLLENRRIAGHSRRQRAPATVVAVPPTGAS
jgi:histidinol-phosphate aminotransferase